jgi:sigma-E factor negative regulatory protein RseC
MGSKNVVTHTGVVESKNNNGIKINFTVISGCASCQIKGNCNMAEQAEKDIFVECNPDTFEIGQKVIIAMKASLGMNAIFLGYVLPFVVLLLTMIISSKYIKDEGLVGIISLTVLAPYYAGLYLFRNNIKKKFSYHVKPYNH